MISFRLRLTVLSSLIVLLLITLVAGAVTSPRRSEPVGAGIPLVASEVVSEVSHLRFRGRHSGDLLRDEVGMWWLTWEDRDMPARTDRVRDLLETLARTRTGSRVAASSRFWVEFGLADPQELILSDDGGRDLAHLLIGDRSETGTERFLRFDSAPEVFSVDAALFFSFERDPVYWSELRMLPEGLSEDLVASITVRADLSDLNDLPRRFEYTLQRSETGDWSLVGPAARTGTRQSRARELVATILSLEGSRYASEAPDVGGEHASVVVRLFDGRQYRLEIAAVDGRFVSRPFGPGVPTDRSGEGISYEVSSWTIERLLRLPEDMTP